MLQQLQDQVSVVFNCAANTTFDERYDVALQVSKPWSECCFVIKAHM
jgi:hypothetical protein